MDSIAFIAIVVFPIGFGLFVAFFVWLFISNEQPARVNVRNHQGYQGDCPGKRGYGPIWSSNGNHGLARAQDEAKRISGFVGYCQSGHWHVYEGRP